VVSLIVVVIATAAFFRSLLSGDCRPSTDEVDLGTLGPKIIYRGLDQLVQGQTSRYTCSVLLFQGSPKIFKGPSPILFPGLSRATFLANYFSIQGPKIV